MYAVTLGAYTGNEIAPFSFANEASERKRWKEKEMGKKQGEKVVIINTFISTILHTHQ